MAAGEAWLDRGDMCETREWVDAEGEQSAGGFYKMLRVVKTAHSLPVVDIASDFFAEERSEFRPWSEKRIVPRLWLWPDKFAAWWDEAAELAIRRAWDEEALEWSDTDSLPIPGAPPAKPQPQWRKTKRFCAGCVEEKVAMHKEIPARSGGWICSGCFASGQR